MSVSDPLGDMLTRIRNAQMRRRPKVSTPASALRGRVLEVLQDEGFINGYARVAHPYDLGVRHESVRWPVFLFLGAYSYSM